MWRLTSSQCEKLSKRNEAEAKILELCGESNSNHIESFSAVARDYDEDKPRNG